jgi:conjugal transfer pilus assembly protein TraV
LTLQELPVKLIKQIVCSSALLILVLLGGCGPLQDAINPYEENFKCQAKNAMGECLDTPTAYRKARYPESKSTQCGDSDLQNKVKQEIQKNRYKTLAGLLEKEKKPLLQPPKVLRVLLLPYKGENEELFMSRYVYIKIEDSQWILTDLIEE